MRMPRIETQHHIIKLIQHINIDRRPACYGCVAFLVLSALFAGLDMLFVAAALLALAVRLIVGLFGLGVGAGAVAVRVGRVALGLLFVAGLVMLGGLAMAAGRRLVARRGLVVLVRGGMVLVALPARFDVLLVCAALVAGDVFFGLCHDVVNSFVVSVRAVPRCRR